LAISAATKVAALKNVDFPVLGFPTTPSKREYERCMSISLSVLLHSLRYIICAQKTEEDSFLGPSV